MSTRGVIGTGVAVWALALGISVRAYLGPPVAAPAAASAQKRAAAPAAPAPPANTDCLACHEDDSAARADGRPVVVKQAVFEKSIHGSLACVDCHQDLAHLAELPHPEKLAKVTCAACHADTVDKYNTSVHASARAQGTSVAATCVDCHGTHDILPKSDPQSRTYHLNLAATCEKCHGNAEIIRKGGIPSDVTKAFEDSIHGRALSRAGLMVAPTCADCHGSHDIRKKQDPGSRVALLNVPATCGTCHEGIANKFKAGIHGQMLAQGNLKAPACQTCHTPHAIQRAETTEWQLKVIGQCGTCHVNRIATFRDTFHGQVTALGSRAVAGCADCHGPHEILPSSDPRSMTAPGNLVATCGKCHANASANFVKYDPHADKHDRAGNPMLFYTAQFMTLLLAGVFSFFGIHTTLWFTRELRLRRERRIALARPVAVKGPTPLTKVNKSREAGDDNAR
jgi:nitrate/TMAO reductase-like tetraheme cytochrome c subunit